jgi:phosphate transport system substrate-binding protein
MSRKKTKVAIVALVLLAIVIGYVVGNSEADTKGSFRDS